MEYRKIKKNGQKISAISFGAMRLPLLVPNEYSSIDYSESEKMLNYAIYHGVNYFDTGYFYHNGESERFIGNFIKNSDNLRKKILIATKLPSWLITNRNDMDLYLNEQLEKLHIDYIDYYYLHGLNQKLWRKLKNLNVFSFIESAISDNKIKYCGFSFHDNFDLFKEIVDYYDWTCCQIQYNFLDEKNQAGQEGLHYASDHDLGVMIMEPLRGGKLVSNVPSDIQSIYNGSLLNWSPAEWGLKWVLNHPEVTTVLSGMSSLSQVSENIHVANSAFPNCLKKSEISIIDKVKILYEKRMKIMCTNCRYCLPCPNGVNIPECFNSYNYSFMFNDKKKGRRLYKYLEGYESGADNCCSCKLCESKCPQNIHIVDLLSDIKKYYA